MPVKLTNEQYIQKCQRTHGDRFDYSVTKYVDSYTKVAIRCRIHGIFYQRPSDHRRGFSCSKCSGLGRRTTKEYIRAAEKIHGKLYDYSKTIFTTVYSPIIVICPKHGEFILNAKDHIGVNQNGCAKCCRSKGEVQIASYLLDNKIEFEEQKIFPGWCKGRFDFYLPLYNLCIEYDGAQHFHKRHIRRHLNQDEEFKKIRYRDLRKNFRCQELGIQLMRISYKHLKNIKSVLDDTLRNYTTLK